MGAGKKTSLKEMGRLLKALFTTARIEGASFWRAAVAACAMKFILYVVTQTVVLIGTPTYTRLSLDADMLCLAVALLAMCRARDANMRGLYGFLGGIASFYGVGVLLVFALKATWIPLTVSTVRAIAIAPQVTQLMFVWWMSRRPTSPLVAARDDVVRRGPDLRRSESSAAMVEDRTISTVADESRRRP